jgi:hypothetical protein
LFCENKNLVDKIPKKVLKSSSKQQIRKSLWR